MPDKTILLVDDEDDIREVAQMCLEEIGHWRVIACASGAEALPLAATAQPDAILLDVMMPEMDGPATVDRLRANPATAAIPVILLTAKVQAMDRKKFAALGVSAILAKPFDPLLLPGEIAQALGWGLRASSASAP